MIDSLKDLEKLLKLLRKQGVTEFKLAGCELKLGDLPPNRSSAGDVIDDADPANPYENFPQGDLTPEQLMFYSSGGTPEDDPDNKDLKQ